MHISRLQRNMTVDEAVHRTVGGCKAAERQALMPFSGDHAAALEPDHAAERTQVAVELRPEHYKVQLEAREIEGTMSYEIDWAQDSERQKRAAHIGTLMHLAIDHRNSGEQAAPERCMAEVLMSGLNTVGSKTGAKDSVEATTFGHTADWEVAGSYSSVEEVGERRIVQVVVEWSTVGWLTGESNGVGLTGLPHSAKLADHANNQGLEDEEEHESVPAHGLRFVIPLQAHGDADGWADYVVRIRLPVVGPCPPRLRGSPSSH
jgi:hypothetical protein